MPRYDFRSPRLYVDAALTRGAVLPLDAAQANYLGNVLRRKAGDSVLVFNGRDGEWRAALGAGRKRELALTIGEQTRPQTAGPDLHYLFAPLKHARLDYMVQKAVEMGASRLQPVLTRHAPGRERQSRSGCGRMPSRPPSNAASSPCRRFAPLPRSNG